MPETPSPLARRPVQVASAEPQSLTALLTLAIFVVVVAVLYLAREVLMPVTLAVLLSFVLAPLANLLRSLRLGRVPSVFVAVLLALGVVLALGGLIGTQLADLAQQTPRYQYTIQHKIEAVRSVTLGNLSSLIGCIGLRLQPRTPDQGARPPSREGSEPPAGAEQKPLPVEVHQPDPSPLELAQRILAPVLGPISTLAIVFVVSIFMLLQREDLRDRLIRLFGSRDLHRTTIAMNDAAERLSRYFLTQLAINATFGVIVGLGLFVIGVPSPILWGVIGTLLRFVPYVGAVLSAVLPAALAAAVDPGWTMLAWTAGLYFVVELVTGQVVEPWAYGHSTGLSPISVVVAATFWTWLWGPIGLILSTPLTLCLVVLGRHVDRLAFLDVILGDSPPLTPIENFYQRMLAGDPDEAQDQAEQLLKEMPLSAYYDEVVLKGLQLAERDVQRGVLGQEQVERINEAVFPLIQDLAAHEDTNPVPRKAAKAAKAAKATKATPSISPSERAPTKLEPAMPVAEREHLPAPWQGETPILCIAGRGLLDGAASAMLAQLLAKHGLGVRDVRHDATSRTNVASLDGSGIAMVCVTYLEIGGSPSHLRYLLRRLRQHLPGVPILVGLWSPEDSVLQDERLRATIGAEHYATSLRDAVMICLRASGAANGPGDDHSEPEDPAVATSVAA
jgi:predicted PurR-regulated permease PerM